MGWDVAVVDSASGSRRHLQIALAAAGYNVVGWSNAGAARAELGVSPPRMLVSELLMDGMDGFDLLSWAREQWGQSVELLAVTGMAWGHVNLGQMVRERFGARFLSKPFLRSELVKVVQEAIGPASAPAVSLPPEWRIGVAESQRAERFAEEYERHLVRLGSYRGRCSVRARAECTVQLNQQGQWVQRTVGNLSAGGLFIESDTPQEPDQVLEIALGIPSLERTFRTRARVAYRVPPDRVTRGERPGFGVEFLDLSDVDRRIIRAYVLDQREEEEAEEAPVAVDGRKAHSWILLLGVGTQQLLGRPGFLHRRGFELASAPTVEDAEELARVRKPALCIAHERGLRPDPPRLLARLGRLVESASCIVVLGPTTLSSLLAAGLCGAVLRPDTPTALLNDEIRQRLGIAEREAFRVPYPAPARVSAAGQLFETEMVDISVGGMLLRAPHSLAVGTEVEVTFDLPENRGLVVRGSVVRNERQRAEPGGRSGLAFLDVDPAARTAIRRFVQSHVPFRDYFVWLKRALFE
jgi:DNA-binding response OmpR family regulator